MLLPTPEATQLSDRSAWRSRGLSQSLSEVGGDGPLRYAHLLLREHEDVIPQTGLPTHSGETSGVRGHRTHRLRVRSAVQGCGLW